MEHKFTLSNKEEEAIKLLAEQNTLTVDEFITKQLVGRFVDESVNIASRLKSERLNNVYSNLDPIKRAQVDAILEGVSNENPIKPIQ